MRATFEMCLFKISEQSFVSSWQCHGCIVPKAPKEKVADDKNRDAMTVVCPRPKVRIVKKSPTI